VDPDLDLSATPWDYPGTSAAASGLLDGDRFLPRPPDELLSLAYASAHGRVAVAG
jgi:hypothetical protein